MIKTLSSAIKSPLIQYLIGLLTNCLYVLILISNDTSYENLQIPEGIYSENLWNGSDVLTYVRPARNFIQYRIFGSGTVPDYRRTIGYPLFLSAMMTLFGNSWLVFALFVQAAIFALIYPILGRISKILYNAHDNVIISAFLFLILAGTFIVRVPLILNDTFFTIFFMLGLWLGIEAIVKKSPLYLGMHIICIAYSAQIRPLLSLFPIVNCVIMVATVRKYGLSRDTRIHQFIVGAFIALLILCNLPAVRNYINHGFPKPSYIFSQDLLDVLGKNVLASVGKSAEYDVAQKIAQGAININEKTSLQEKLAMKIYTDYPLATFKQIIRNAIVMMGRSHWPLVANFWGYNYKDDISTVLVSLKKSKIAFLIEVSFNVIYLAVFYLFVRFLIRTIRSKNFLFLFANILCIGNFLIPALIYRWGGSRLRLPVEGLIVIMAFCELEFYRDMLKYKFLRLLDRIPLIKVPKYSS